MTAVLFASLAGALFGGMAVAIRFALRSSPYPLEGAFAVAAGAAATSLLATAAAEPHLATARVGDLWPFALAGLAVPATSHVFFVLAVRDSGPARTAVTIGAAPLLSALLAIGLLGEPFRLALAGGTVLIVLGGTMLAWERTRPERFRGIGIAFAVGCAILFGVRDNVVRWGTRQLHPPPLAAATTSAAVGAAALLAVMLVVRRGGLAGRLRGAIPAYLPAGILFGLAYDALLEAFDHGKVTVVAPLNATQSLWAVALAATLVGRSELIGRRLVLAAVLIVAGSSLIGAVR